MDKYYIGFNLKKHLKCKEILINLNNFSHFSSQRNHFLTIESHFFSILIRAK